MSVEESLQSPDVAWFSCKGNLRTSYLKSGYFQKFIDLDLHLTKNTTIELFGKCFPTSSCVWTCTHKLFMAIKKTFAQVKSITIDNMNYSTNEHNSHLVKKMRIDILKVLQFFVADIQSFGTNNLISISDTSVENNYLKNYLLQITTEVKKLLLFVGCISNINGITNIKDFNGTSVNAINLYHYFHLCLDIWYNCIALVNAVHSVTSLNENEVFCTDFNYSSPILQLSSVVIHDLIHIALQNYKTINMFKNSPFLCSCISDLWIMLIHFLDENKPFLEEETSFWDIYQTCLQNITKITSQNINEDPPLDTLFIVKGQYQNCLEACFWITSHIATLYKHNIFGHFSEYKEVKSGYITGKYLMCLLLSSASGIKEENLRNVLGYCIQMIKLWEPSGDMLLPLTDFYIKKIGETFSIHNIEIKGLSYLYRDSLSWFTYIKNLKNCICNGKESSFDLFLCIVCLQLKYDIDNKLWRSLKGRIYSKFIPRKVKDISEIGLQNSLSLFLMIAACGQHEIIGKICEISSTIETTGYVPKQMVSWKALFTLLHILQNGKHNMDKLIHLIAKYFNSSCSDFARISNNSTRKIHLMNLLLLYTDNMNGLLKTSNNLDLSEYQLIEAGFKDLFSACSISEINYVLGSFLEILQRIDRTTEADERNFSSNETQYIGMLQCIFNNIYPFLRDIATTATPPPLTSDFAGILTKLTYKFSSSLIDCVPVDYHAIFFHFGSKENVNSSIACRYLCFILDCPNVMNELKLKVPSLTTVLFQSWLKCTIYIHMKCKHMQEFTKKILCQNEITEIFPGVKNIIDNSEDHTDASIKFYKLIGDVFSKTSDSGGKTKIAQETKIYFKNYANYVVDKIKKGKDRTTFVYIYKLISHLVESCSIVLHFQATSNSILLQILDQTIYPQLLFPRDKALQSLVSCSIKEYLPNFIKGLSKLDYRKDKSIEREIRDIFMYYLGIYPASHNPLTKLVIDSATRKPEALTLDAYNFILDILKSRLLLGNVEKPKGVIEFYQEVFRSVPPACKKEVTNVLLICALEIYMKRNDSLSEYLKVLLKKNLIHIKENIPSNDAKVILYPVIEWFVHEKLKWSVVRGFGVLGVFVEYLPHIMLDMVPLLTKSVQVIEMSRGSGEDIVLRSGLRNIIAKLQHRLAEEKR